MAASSQELRYMIVFTTEGKAQLVEATEELKEQEKAHKLSRVSSDQHAKGVQDLKKHLASLSNEVIDVNELLKRNSLELEKARLEYETGAISSDKYAEKLESLNSQLGRINNPTKAVVTQQRRLHKELGSVQKGMDRTGKSTATTNNLLIALTRGAQDAQFGMMGMANNLQQSAELAASASQQMGGMKNVVMGLASSFMNPATGLIIGVTAITTAWQLAESGAFNFGVEIENLDEIAEEHINTIDQLAQKTNDLIFPDEDFFDTEGLQNRLRMQMLYVQQEEQHLKTLEEEHRMWQEIGANRPADYDTERANFVIEQMQLAEASIAQSKEKQLELEAKIGGIQRTRNNDLFMEEYLRQQMYEATQEMDKLISDWADNDITGQIASDIQKMNESMAEGEDPFAMLGDPSDRLKELRAQMQAQLKFEEQIEQQRIQLAKQTGDELTALRMEEKAELRALENNELINDRQREEMRLLIIEEYNNKELALEQKKQQKVLESWKKANDEMVMQEQWMHDQRINMTTMAADTILSINQAFFGNNKAINALVFGVEKSFQIANVLLDTKRRAAQAVMTGMSLLSSPVTAPLAGNAFAQAAAIKATGYTTAALMGAMTLAQGAGMMAGGGRSGGASGGFGGGGNPNPVASFRGIQSDAVNGRDERKMTGTLRLEDGAGKFLTKLQFDQDQSDSGGYVGG